MNNELRSFYNFRNCVSDAPEGTYDHAKQLAAILGDAMDGLMRDLRAAGFRVDGCDKAFRLEAAMYDYVKSSNPDATVFPVSEGFGGSMSLSLPVRERVIAQAERSRDFLRSQTKAV